MQLRILFRRNCSCSVHGLKYKSIHGLLTGLHDDPLPENKTIKVRTDDGRTDRKSPSDCSNPPPTVCGEG